MQQEKRDLDAASASPEISSAELAHEVQSGSMERYLAEALDAVGQSLTTPAEELEMPQAPYRAYKLDIQELRNHGMDGFYLLIGDILLQVESVHPADHPGRSAEEHKALATRIAEQVKRSLIHFYHEFWSGA